MLYVLMAMAVCSVVCDNNTVQIIIKKLRIVLFKKNNFASLKGASGCYGHTIWLVFGIRSEATDQSIIHSGP